MAIFFKPKNPKQKTMLHSTGELVESLVIALIMALIIKTSIVEAYKIPSGSMENTLLVGDFLLANKFVYGMKLPIPFTDIKLPAIEDPRPGDIIIFKFPLNQDVNYIKRCVATEGQTVEVRNKELYVDGKHIPLPPHGKHIDPHVIPYYNDMMHGGMRDNMPPQIVPEGHLFVMGDNRDNSQDSRFWGFLDKRLVMGRALIIHWSWEPDPDPLSLKPGDFFAIPKEAFHFVVSIPKRIRWSRLGDIIV
jgi:signal peptidase I